MMPQINKRTKKGESRAMRALTRFVNAIVGYCSVYLVLLIMALANQKNSVVLVENQWLLDVFGLFVPSMGVHTIWELWHSRKDYVRMRRFFCDCALAGVFCMVVCHLIRLYRWYVYLWLYGMVFAVTGLFILYSLYQAIGDWQRTKQGQQHE